MISGTTANVANTRVTTSITKRPSPVRAKVSHMSATIAA
jgi:hypothetical protein